VCYAAEDWPVFNNVILARNRQLPDDDRMLKTYQSIFKTFNVNNLSVCIGWCADQVTLFSLFHFPMPLASTAHNIILPLENVRIRYLLLRHCTARLHLDADLMKFLYNFVNVNMSKGKHCPAIRITSALPPIFIPTILGHTNYSTTSQLLINYSDTSANE
jgi:hypothetical protein